MVRDTVWESGGNGDEYGEEENERERHCVCVWIGSVGKET